MLKFLILKSFAYSLLYLALAVFFIESIIRLSAFQFGQSEPVDAEHGNLKKCKLLLHVMLFYTVFILWIFRPEYCCFKNEP